MKPITFKVYVQPGAKQSEFAGQYGDAVKIRINTPPIEGRANEALIAFLSKVLKVRKSAIKIKRGNNSRIKLVAVSCDEQTDYAALQERVDQLLRPAN